MQVEMEKVQELNFSVRDLGQLVSEEDGLLFKKLNSFNESIDSLLRREFFIDLVCFDQDNALKNLISYSLQENLSLTTRNESFKFIDKIMQYRQNKFVDTFLSESAHIEGLNEVISNIIENRKLDE